MHCQRAMPVGRDRVSCSIPNQLNPGLNGESRLDKSRLSTMVAGAGFEPTTFAL